MGQQRKKDFSQRLIEDFFNKLSSSITSCSFLTDTDKKTILNECFAFFYTHFNISKEDEAPLLMEKINDNDLLVQYAKLLMIEYDITDKNKEDLTKALRIVELIHNADATYSLEQTVLREDLLRRLDEVI